MRIGDDSCIFIFVNCVVCDDKKARAGSLTCSDRHAATLRMWAWRHRPKILFEGVVIGRICQVCDEPLLVDVDNGQVRYHVECAKIARNCADAGAAYPRV